MACSLSNFVHYVGSSNNIEARFAEHRDGTNKGDWGSRRAAWLSRCRKDRIPPQLHILELVPEGELLLPREQYWFDHYRAIGQANLNAERRIWGNMKDALAQRVIELERDVEILREEIDMLSEDADSALHAHNQRLRENLANLFRENTLLRAQNTSIRALCHQYVPDDVQDLTLSIPGPHAFSFCYRFGREVLLAPL